MASTNGAAVRRGAAAPRRHGRPEPIVFGPTRTAGRTVLVAGLLAAHAVVMETAWERMRDLYAFAGPGSGARRGRYLVDLLAGSGRWAAIAAVAFVAFQVLGMSVRDQETSAGRARGYMVVSVLVQAAAGVGALALAACGALMAELTGLFPDHVPPWWVAVALAAVPAFLWGAATTAHAVYRLAIALLAGPALVGDGRY